MRSIRARSTGSGATPIVPTIRWAISMCRGPSPSCRARVASSPRSASILSYFVDDQGFARPTAPMPGDGPTWISGLTVLKDAAARERMFAFYAKIRKMLEVYERGLAEFNPETKRFEKVVQFPDADNLCRRVSRRSSVSSSRTMGSNYVYYAIRIPLLPHAGRPGTPQGAHGVRGLHLPGTGHAASRSSRSTAVAEGRLHYGWKTNTQLVRQDQQTKLIASRRIKPRRSRCSICATSTRARRCMAHGGSVYWNAYRKRWVMITVESFGSTSTSARSGMPRPTRRWARGSTPARS